MSEPIATERYRLALIAHHAEKLAELMRNMPKDNKWWNRLLSSSFIASRDLSEFAKRVSEQLNKEKTK